MPRRFTIVVETRDEVTYHVSAETPQEALALYHDGKATYGKDYCGSSEAVRVIEDYTGNEWHVGDLEDDNA